MKWYGQVLHVLRKDVRLVGWLLAAYMLVVAAATASAVEWGALAGTPSFLWMVLLLLVGTVIMAILVQADSPARVDAYWAVLPLRPSAVLSAKLLGAALLLVLLPLLGQFAALLAHDVPAGDLPILMWRSVEAYGAWLAIIAAAAALTRDFRSFLVTIVLFLVGLILIGFVTHAFRLHFTPERLTEPAAHVPRLAVAAGLLLLVAHQYFTRNTRRGIWIASTLILLMIALPRVLGTAAQPASIGIPEGLPAELRPRILFRPPGLHSQEMNLTIQLESASDFHGYMLVDPVFSLQMENGTVVRLESDAGSSDITLNAPVVPLPDGVRWLGEPPLAQTPWTQIRLEADSEQRAALANGRARVEVEGTILVLEPSVSGRLPLREGALLVREGQRTRVMRAEASGSPSVELRWSWIAPAELGNVGHGDLPRDTEPRLLRYLLVHEARGEAVGMRQGSSSGNPLSALVLPGPATWTRTMRIEAGHDFAATRVQVPWEGGADLLFIEWQPAGSLFVRGRAGISREDPRP